MTRQEMMDRKAIRRMRNETRQQTKERLARNDAFAANAESSSVPYVVECHGWYRFRTDTAPRCGGDTFGATAMTYKDHGAKVLEVFASDFKWHPVVCCSDEYFGPISEYKYREYYGY
mgnify:CR=1 FL=1